MDAIKLFLGAFFLLNGFAGIVLIAWLVNKIGGDGQPMYALKLFLALFFLFNLRCGGLGEEGQPMDALKISLRSLFLLNGFVGIVLTAWLLGKILES